MCLVICLYTVKPVLTSFHFVCIKFRENMYVKKWSKYRSRNELSQNQERLIYNGVYFETGPAMD